MSTNEQRAKWLDQLENLATAYGLTVDRQSKPFVSGAADAPVREVRHTLTISYREPEQ